MLSRTQMGDKVESLATKLSHGSRRRFGENPLKLADLIPRHLRMLLKLETHKTERKRAWCLVCEQSVRLNNPQMLH